MEKENIEVLKDTLKRLSESWFDSDKGEINPVQVIHLFELILKELEEIKGKP